MRPGHCAGTPDRAGRPEPLAVPGRRGARRGARRLVRHLARRRRRLGPARRDLHLELVRAGPSPALTRCPTSGTSGTCRSTCRRSCSWPCLCSTCCRRRPVGLLCDPRWPLPALHLVALPHGGRPRAADPGTAPDHRSGSGRFVLGVLAACGAAAARATAAGTRGCCRTDLVRSRVLALVPLLFCLRPRRRVPHLGRDGTCWSGRSRLFFTAIALGGTSRLLDGVVGHPDRWSGSAATPCCSTSGTTRSSCHCRATCRHAGWSW